MWYAQVCTNVENQKKIVSYALKIRLEKLRKIAR